MGVLYHGDCLDVLPSLDGESVDACITDPPYHLSAMTKRFGKAGSAPAHGAAFQRHNAGFMGKAWDGGDIAFRPETWAEVFRVLKPGAHLVAFGGSRTYHRLACAIEDAGFEIRDCLVWLYGSGMPKSHNISKAIDKAAGATREVIAQGKAVKRMIPGADQNATGSWIKDNGRDYVPTITAPATDDAVAWAGWGTALKPAMEPIVLARKPRRERSTARNCLVYGTGALNIEACQIAFASEADEAESKNKNQHADFGTQPGGNAVYGDYSMVAVKNYDATGRWPANVLLDEEAAPLLNEAARFFYTAKADRAERSEGTLRNTHPTVKPVDLMAWLVRLVTPPNGVVLDPFLGSGSTAIACEGNGFYEWIGIEREEEYVHIARERIGLGCRVSTVPREE